MRDATAKAIVCARQIGAVIDCDNGPGCSFATTKIHLQIWPVEISSNKIILDGTQPLQNTFPAWMASSEIGRNVVKPRYFGSV